MKKNDIIKLHITDISVNGEGMGRFDNQMVLVKNAVPGDSVEAVVTRCTSKVTYAKALNIITPSPDRIEPPCPHALRCGGCQVMELDYIKQLEIKELKVKNNLERIGGQKDFVLRHIIGMNRAESGEIPLHYRNKTQYPVGLSKDGRVITGFYAGRTHYIIESDNCLAAPEANASILKAICDFIEEARLSVYDEATGKGLIRHILIRNGFHTGQTMVCLVINGFSLNAGSADGCEAKGSVKTEDLLVEALLKADPSITSVCLNINTANTNVIMGDRCITLYGNDYIEDKIKDLTFRISPLAFFQVNGWQTEKLYDKALEYASLSGRETVWDLYCGTGTISLFLAQKAAHVYGVEIIKPAVDNAFVNAELNNISNASFYAGKSEVIFPEKCKNIPPDVVVVDPPRKGCDKALLDAILEVAPERIVYVSCDSATLARDIKILSEKYSLIEATPVDMFPHTVHVETVALLSKRSV